MKKKLLDILVVGSGLSSLSFINSYLEKNKKIDLISYDKVIKKKIPNINKHIFKFLPPQMAFSEKKVKEYFFFNKLKINKNCNIFGSLEFGGLSNYWGLQIDTNIEKDLKSLKKKTKKEITKCFFETLQIFQLIGNLKTEKKNYNNSYVKNSFFNEKFYSKDKDIIIEEPILGYKKKNNQKYLKPIDEKKNKFIPKFVFKNFINKKKIVFHNCYVEKIEDYKRNLLITCTDGRKKLFFYTKKLVLGCGTIISTKLIMDYLNIKKEIKIHHHPRLFSLFFLKKKWKNKMDFQPSNLHLKSRRNPDLFTSDFRPGNVKIINALVKFKIILKPFKYLLYYLKEHFIFSNMFLNSKYSNLYIKKINNSFEVYSKTKSLKKIFKKNSQIIYNFLIKTKKIFPFFINYFPGFGSDFHYFGTIPINGKGTLSSNDNGQLKKNKKIYLIDGSVFNFKVNKYPLGLVLANSRRIGKNI